MFYAYLSLGSNLGNKEGNLKLACRSIEKACGDILSRSGIYESAAWGYESEEDYYNQCILIKTSLDPIQLLDKLNGIEDEMGRVRLSGSYSDRNIDIDIIMYESLHISTPRLQIPHPRMTERNFVLQPLKEIAPELVHPILNKSIGVLADECSDSLKYVRLGHK